MPRLKTPKKPEDKTPVFTWAFKSSKAPLVGGSTFDYVAQLNQDGTVSCNCPGWRFVKKGQLRRCRHTDAIQGEVPDIMQSWRDGKTFTVQEYTAPAIHAAPTADTKQQTKKTKPAANSRIRFNRVVEY